MLYSITHRTRLNYSQPISESVMEVRLMPRSDERQVLRQFDLSVSPRAKSTYHADWLGNTVHQFSVLSVHSELSIMSKCIVESRSPTYSVADLKAPLEGLIRDHRSWDFLQYHGAVVDDPGLPALVSRIGLGEARHVGEAIEIVMRRMRDVITYKPGVTNSQSTVPDVLRLGAGVCQDFAHVGLALLRRAGVPCRYVSGYVHKAGMPEFETHAWIEAFVPGVGWLGFDPTHGQLVKDQYVAIAVGRSYADVPPNRGVYRGDAKETIEVKVTMEPLEERSRLTPYSNSSDRRAHPVSSPPPPRGLSLGLEHQLAHPNAVGLVVQQQRQQQQ